MLPSAPWLPDVPSSSRQPSGVSFVPKPRATLSLWLGPFGNRRAGDAHWQRGIRAVRGLEAALSILTTFAARPQDPPFEDTGSECVLRFSNGPRLLEHAAQ
jgi:hypothetical protein